MQAPSPRPRRLSDYTVVWVELFVAAFTILPFFALAYFYPVLPERVPLFMSPNGEVAVWGAKSWLSVYRVALMAAVTQVVCLLMKYGVVQSAAAPDAGEAGEADDRARLYGQSAALGAGLWDWFRCIAAFKMGAATLDVISLGVERLRFLSKPAFVVTLLAALLSVPVALYYGRRLLILRRRMREAFGEAGARKPVDAGRVYGGLLYFNPSDPALFVNRYGLNFADVRAWVFMACLIAYPLLVFLPA